MARAQSSAEAGPLLDRAKESFRRGVALLNAGDTERALEAFLASRALVPSGKNTANAGICLERLGRYDEALELYEEVLARFAADLDVSDRSSLAPVMANLRAKIGYLEVSSNVDGLLVVDGRDRGRLPLSTALRVMPGLRVLRIVKDGYRTFEKRIEVKQGVNQQLDAELEPLAGRGAVRIEGPGAPVEVFVDGERLGTTPFEGTLGGGRHILRTEGGGRGTAPQHFDVLPGRTLVVRVVPQLLGPALSLSATPPTAEISLGTVPLGRGAWQGRLPLGSYVLRASEPGYFDATRAFRVDAVGAPSVLIPLTRDPDHQRWPRQRVWTFEVNVALGGFLAPTLNAGAEGSCPSLCAGSRIALGAFGSASIAARHTLGFGPELVGGYLALRQRFTRAVQDPFWDGGTHVATYVLEHDGVARGPFLALRGRYARPLIGGFESFGAVGGGLWFGTYDVETGGSAFTDSEIVSATSVPASASRASPFVSAALGLQRTLGIFGVRFSLGAWFFPTRGPVLGSAALGVAPNCEPGSPPGAVGCAPQSDALAGERAHGSFFALTPELAATYAF